MTTATTVAECLRDPRCYPDDPTSVEVIETHISWVFLTQRFAYKLKKPVRFDFLDFSTAELRHTACENEVCLNRRLAPTIYLGVVPVTAVDDGYRVNGSGPPVDWLVKMRRLPKDRALDVLIRNETVTDRDVDQVAAALTDFYRQLPPISQRTDSYLQEIDKHVRGNRRELLSPNHGFHPAQVRRIHGKQLRVLRLSPDLLRNRVLDGRIVEGHGDLRPEHIYLNGQPNVIDCIEFNTEFRILDVVDELSFLAVECSHLGAKWMGGQILDYYCRTTGDTPPAPLLAFYMGYRACVRAKVMALRAAQLGPPKQQKFRDDAQSYLDLADEYAKELGQPMMVVVRGLMGTGKSTLAIALQQALDMELLQTDAVRREILGTSERPAAYGADRYSTKNRQAVYDEMFRRADAILADQQSLILDGTFLTRQLRAQAASLARRHGALFLMIHCRCPDQVAIGRIKARQLRGGSLSEARPELFDQQRNEEESDPSGIAARDVDTTAGTPEMLARVFESLSQLLGKV